MVSGDLTGKLIVPIKRSGKVYETSFLGLKEIARSEAELHLLEKRVADAGYYPYVADHEELLETGQDREKVTKIFSELVVERMRSWIKLADERLRGTGVKFYMMLGNDDDPSIVPILRSSASVIDPTTGPVWLDDDHEMISMGAANHTPWETIGEHSEEELREIIKGMMKDVSNLKNLIFNFHCPPYNSSLDICPKLDDQLRPVRIGSNVLMAPAGSTAVREAIERYQPLLGVFGHIHESPGEVHIGRTLCLNPGSEYSQGILRGYVIDLEGGKVTQYFRTEG